MLRIYKHLDINHHYHTAECLQTPKTHGVDEVTEIHEGMAESPLTGTGIIMAVMSIKSESVSRFTDNSEGKNHMCNSALFALFSTSCAIQHWLFLMFELFNGVVKMYAKWSSQLASQQRIRSGKYMKCSDTSKPAVSWYEKTTAGCPKRKNLQKQSNEKTTERRQKSTLRTRGVLLQFSEKIKDTA